MRIFVNGKLISSTKAYPLPEEGRIFIFESLKSYGQKIFRLEEHLTRLFESAHTIGLECPKSKEKIIRELKSCLKASGKEDAFIRLGMDEKHTYILIGERKRPAWIYEKGISIKTAATRRSVPAAIPSEPKTSAFLNNVLAELERIDKDVIYDSILLDMNGYVTEGTVWNIFMIKSETLLTPSLGILNGVTRQFVIECAAKEGLPVQESNIMRHDIWNADEVFLTNTSGEIVPVKNLDGRQIGEGIPGPVTKRLMSRFKEELQRELIER